MPSTTHRRGASVTEPEDPCDLVCHPNYGACCGGWLLDDGRPDPVSPDVGPDIADVGGEDQLAEVSGVQLGQDADGDRDVAVRAENLEAGNMNWTISGDVSHAITVT